jgi:hypothetical protein
MKESKVAITIVGLLIALGVAALPLSEWENEFGNVWHLLGYEALWWALVLFTLLSFGSRSGSPSRRSDFLLPISAAFLSESQAELRFWLAWLQSTTSYLLRST